MRSESPLEGPTEVALCSPPKFLRRGENVTPARRAGLKFQARAEKWFRRTFSSSLEVHIGEWLRYRDRKGTHWCQPDAWVMGRSRLAVFEFKFHHSEAAWWQLKLYGALLGALYGVPVVSVEMTKSFDPAEPWAGPKPRVVFTEAALFEALVEESEAPVVFQWAVTP